MENVCISFEKIYGITPDETKKGKSRPGREHVNVHIIIDIKVDVNFTRKTRLVAEGHTTAPQ